MSMEHKAFVFDTKKFHAEIEPVMKDSIKNTEVAHQYICNHLYDYSDCFSAVKPLVSKADIAIANLEVTLGGKPYRGYPAFSAPDAFLYAIKECGFDILLTACYDVEDDRGLGEMWDAVNEVIKELDVFEEGELPVTGWTVEIDDVIVDPGMEGLGIIDCDDSGNIEGEQRRSGKCRTRRPAVRSRTGGMDGSLRRPLQPL